MHKNNLIKILLILLVILFTAITGFYENLFQNIIENKAFAQTSVNNDIELTYFNYREAIQRNDLNTLQQYLANPEQIQTGNVLETTLPYRKTKDLEITRVEFNKDRALLYVQGRLITGESFKGIAVMVNQSRVWKILDESWSRTAAEEVTQNLQFIEGSNIIPVSQITVKTPEIAYRDYLEALQTRDTDKVRTYLDPTCQNLTLAAENGIIPCLRIMVPESVIVNSVRMSGNQAFLNVTGQFTNNQCSNGNVVLIKDCDNWKVQSEVWDNILSAGLAGMLRLDPAPVKPPETELNMNKPLDNAFCKKCNINLQDTGYLMTKSGPDIEGESCISGSINISKREGDGYLKLVLTRAESVLSNIELKICNDRIISNDVPYTIGNIPEGTYNVNGTYIYGEQYNINHIQCSNKIIKVRTGEKLNGVNLICR